MREFCFEGSEIAQVSQEEDRIVISFASIRLRDRHGSEFSQHRVEPWAGRMELSGARCKRLPKPGILTDGELYGMAGKALNGRLPLVLSCQGELELELAVEDRSVTILCQQMIFHVAAELTEDRYRQH